MRPHSRASTCCIDTYRAKWPPAAARRRARPRRYWGAEAWSQLLLTAKAPSSREDAVDGVRGRRADARAGVLVLAPVQVWQRWCARTPGLPVPHHAACSSHAIWAGVPDVRRPPCSRCGGHGGVHTRSCALPTPPHRVRVPVCQPPLLPPADDVNGMPQPPNTGDGPGRRRCTGSFFTRMDAGRQRCTVGWGVVYEHVWVRSSAIYGQVESTMHTQAGLREALADRCASDASLAWTVCNT